jgi:SAM-dependent methyltransferase
MSRVRESYDAVATAYAENLFRELDAKPLDRHLLRRFAEDVGEGAVLEVGCGPGQVTRYLHDLGVRVTGTDLSPGMVATAASLSPGVPFREADMLALDAPDSSFAGVVSFYAIVHLADDELARALREWRRVLAPGGVLLLAFHVGTETVHRDELWGRPVSLDFRFFPVGVVTRSLAEAGLHVLEVSEREPYEGAEHPSRRCYILSRRRAESAP